VASTIQADSPFGLGDQLLLQVMGSGHQVFGGAQYSVPLLYAGTRLAVRFNYLAYALTDRFTPLDAHGTARTMDASLSHPFIRRNRTNLIGTLSIDHHRLKDHVDVTASSNPRSLLGGTAQVQANHTDTWLGPTGVSTASFSFTYGTLEFHDPANAFFDELTARTAGDFHKFTLALSRLQMIRPRLALFAGVDGQYAPGNLDSYEKFFLSGPTAVRAYPVGEASGDRGVVATAEVRWRVGTLFGGAIETAPLYDFGIVNVNARPFAVGPNERRLHGPGLRLGWAQARGLSLGATVAFRGGAPFQSVPDRSYTAWLSASYRF
jgi:hemolysin activation/secretion protein